MRGKKKCKPKAKFGTVLAENSDAFGQGFSLAGQAVGGIAPAGSLGGGAASGALKGAGALASLGPLGMAAGAIGGGAMGLINAKKAQQAEADAKQQQQAMISKNLMNNAGNAFNHGGVMDSKLKVLSGGSLKKISKDAVQVDANNPQQSDSVELEEAFVDHNEVIDKNNRVFSDSVFLPNGKSVAKEVKNLEKMKSKNQRFKGSNDLVDSKIDALFNYQERSKKPGLKKGLAGGGRLIGYNTDGSEMYAPETELLQSSTKVQTLTDKEPVVDLTHANTGVLQQGLETYKNVLDNQQRRTTLPKIDQGKALTGLATYAPNVVNSFLQKRLQGPNAPMMETATRLKTINANDQLASAAGDYKMATDAVSRGTAQGSAVGSNVGNLLAKKLSATNQIYGAVNRENAQIQNQEAFLNQQTKARNVERTNHYGQAVRDFANRKQIMTSENVANLGEKVLAQGREKNQIELDKYRFDIIKSQFGDSGIFNDSRDLGKVIAEHKLKNKMGGKLKKKKK